jgi:hypothetical protein
MVNVYKEVPRFSTHLSLNAIVVQSKNYRLELMTIIELKIYNSSKEGRVA